MNEVQAIKLIEKCLDEMYKKSTPSTTWKKIKETYSGKPIAFYQLHAIAEKDYEEIKEKYEKKLGKIHQNDFDMLLLSYSPTIKE
jgi:hypothetical protein